MVSQIVAVGIFATMFVLIVMDKVERHYVTLGAGVLTIALVFGVCMHSSEALFATLNLHSIATPGFWYAAGEAAESSTGINWATILFIGGMMIMVEGMGRAGFFRWLCLALAKLVHYHTVPIFVNFMIISAVLSMFIDSITVILFLAAVTCELGKVLQFNPVPMIISEVFCANLGGSATMCGDPPNIIIGTSLGFSFFDFLDNTGVAVLIALVVVVLYFFWCFHRELWNSEVERDKSIVYPNPKDAVDDWRRFGMSCGIFAMAIVLLITHAETGLTVATIGILTAVLTLVTAGAAESHYILRRVDYRTLLFFVGLFIAVGGLEQTGVLERLAGAIDYLSDGKLIVMVTIILWASAIASAFVDNIPFAATMIPVIKSMAAAQGVPLSTLAWALSLGVDIGGNGTPIGASANVVGTSVARKNGHFITWGYYCRYAAPATVIAVTICMGYLFLRYC